MIYSVLSKDSNKIIEYSLRDTMGDDDIKEFVPRPYQEELLRIAIEQNTILYLPTGSGKTYIAVMLIKEMGAQISNLTYEEGAKRTIFLVNTVALVDQQAKYLKEYTPFTVGAYSGESQCDFWTKEQWQMEISKFQVLVMTVQILLNIVQHAFFELERCNVLIFDECHHAVDDHPMRMLMQYFENMSASSAPKVLGLTATLLNRNVKPSNVLDEVKNLERTYNSKIASVEALNNVLGYSTNPDETVRVYGCDAINTVQQTIIGMVHKLQDIIADVKFNKCHDNLHRSKSMTLIIESADPDRRINNVLKDIEEHVVMCGLYGGSKALLAHKIQFERLKRHASDENTYRIMQVIITELTKIMKYLDDILSMETDLLQRILKFSSTKVLNLIEIVRNYYAVQQSVQPIHSIVFVQKRFTAKVLYHIFKNLKLAHSDFDFINTDFMVGFNNNPYNDTRESVFERKQNLQVVDAFKRHNINLLFATNVIEEGLDIPQCTLVIMFDLPLNYRSYIQSKGRARHKDSRYIMLCPSDKQQQFNGKLIQYREVERILQNMLMTTEKWAAPTQSEVEAELYNHKIEPYCVESTGAKATLVSAIPMISRYCLSLPQDMFTTLTPFWYKCTTAAMKNSKCSFQVILELPTVSRVREDIRSPFMDTIKDAKRAAALIGIQKLHQAGELNDHLLPHSKEKVLEDVDFLFKHIPTDLPSSTPRPGTKNYRRRYVKRCPDVLTSACPTERTQTLYLHVIQFIPLFDCPNGTNQCSKVFFDNYILPSTFALLTTKRLPQICDFSIYQSYGEIRVHLLINQVVHERLTVDDLHALKTFHAFIFACVLKLLKPFFVFDNYNDENSYLVVPVKLQQKQQYCIDLAVAREFKTMDDVDEPSVQVRRNLHVTVSDYMGAVVYPWYRNREIGYVVCDVTQLNAMSEFPSDNYETYVDYYKDKWGVDIESPREPLLLVKAMSSRLNCLKPRGDSKNNFKKKVYENEENGEHFIPELCVRMPFPSQLWLKANCLPSILHRIHYLLLADELRQQINNECHIGRAAPPEKWQTLHVENYLLKASLEEDNRKKPGEWKNSENFVSGRQSPVGEVLNMKKLEIQWELTDHLQYPWKEEQEPIDIERHIETVTAYEIDYYVNFITQKLKCDSSSSSYDYYNSTLSPQSSPAKLAITYQRAENHFTIDILERTLADSGPELSKVYQAITSAHAQDLMNLERFETLGDSFLKFGASLYLMLKFPDWNEGYLTLVKGRIIGNKNLFYCGNEKQLGTIMKVNDFEPNSGWFPPKFYMPRIVNNNIGTDYRSKSYSVLFNFNIPFSEQMSGCLSADTQQHIQETIRSSLDEHLELSDSMEDYIGEQIVSDKAISDCVESLIGCYLCSNGVPGAFKLLEWFDILPKDDNPSMLMHRPAPSPFLKIARNVTQGDIEFRLPNCKKLEQTLNYTFNNRAYLLQALTHSSYNANRITDCYQRLEFIGDAILDFLITCYIYEQCGDDKTPGDITDLRSALVNNVVFASLSVKYDFHKYLLVMNSKLTDVILNFVRYQEKRKFVIDEEVLILLEEGDYKLAEYIDVPKVLGDVFESIAGAIFLDSGMNLKRVWEVIYPLMKEQIDQFSMNIPQNPVRMLYEKISANPKFCKIDVDANSGKSVSKLSFYIDGQKKLVYGFGDNRKQAKRAAAKIALRAINANKKIDELCCS